MSSWRNLMTPPQEKYYINEGSPSLEGSYGQDKFQQEVSDFTDELSTRQPVIQSEKFKVLHSQLNQLRDDLGRSSVKSNYSRVAHNQSVSIRKTSQFEKSELLEATPRPATQVKRRGILRDTQDRDLPSASTCSGFSRRFQSKEVEVNDFDQSGRTIFGDSFDGKSSQSQAKSQFSSVQTHKSFKNSENVEISQKLGRRSSKKVEFRSDSMSSQNTLQETLAECCQQISDLKRICVSSQKQINSLCEEVTKQKNASEEIRKHLGFSTDVTPTRKTDYSSAKTYLRQSKLATPNTFSEVGSWNCYWTEAKNKQSKDASPVVQAPLSWRGENPKGRNILSSFKSSEDKHSELSTEESPYLRQSYKEAGVQCDTMLDAIIDYDEDEIEQKDKELGRVKSELEAHKEEKKDMISIFQKMLGQLEAAEERDAQVLQKNIVETQKTFSDFYGAFNSKLRSINQSRYQDTRYNYKARPQPQ